MKNDAAFRPTETGVMVCLEQMTRLLEEAQGFIQDDSRITGQSDREEIRDRMLRLRSISLEVERLLFDRVLPGV